MSTDANVWPKIFSFLKTAKGAFALIAGLITTVGGLGVLIGGTLIAIFKLPERHQQDIDAHRRQDSTILAALIEYQTEDRQRADSVDAAQDKQREALIFYFKSTLCLQEGTPSPHQCRHFNEDMGELAAASEPATILTEPSQ